MITVADPNSPFIAITRQELAGLDELVAATELWDDYKWNAFSDEAKRAYNVANLRHSARVSNATPVIIPAAVPPQVSSITLVAGGPPIHVTVKDQNGNALLPANISWPPPAMGVTITSDLTGFNFSAAANAASSTTSAAPTYTGPGAPPMGTVLASLTVVVVGVPTVTGVQFTSP